MTDILNIMTLNVILVQINYDVECYFGLYQSLPTALCCVIFDVHSWNVFNIFEICYILARKQTASKN